MTRRQRKRRGFSALELLLALGMATLVALGTLMLLGQRYKSSTQTRAALSATTQARRTLEAITSMASAAGTFEQLERGLFGPGGPLLGAQRQGDPRQGGVWTGTTPVGGMTQTVSLQHQAQDPAGLLTLTITVSHPQLQTPITLQTRVVP